MPTIAVVRGMKLTNREIQVIDGVAHGWTDKQIGERLTLAESTVKTYIRLVFAKMGARNRAHAVTLCFAAGYLKMPRSREEAKAAVAEAVLLS